MMSKVEITFDARMSEHSGIGTYIRNMIRELSHFPEVDLTVICKRVNGLDLRCVKKIHYCEDDIYTIKEQFSLIRFFPKKTSNRFFWSPHINVPLFYFGNLIVTVHDLLFYEKEIFQQSLLKRIYRNLFFQNISRRAKVIFTPSHFTKEKLNNIFPATQIKSFAIHLGVGNEWKEKKAFDKKREIVFVGNIKKNKRLSLLLQAFECIKNLIPHNLVIIGANDNLRSKENLSRFLIDTSRVVISGKISDQHLIQRVGEADLVVCPSAYEGFGLVPVESYALGTKTLCSDIPAHKEVMGGYANFFKADDVASCANEMLESLQQKQLEVKTDFFDKYSWKRSADETFKVIQHASTESCRLSNGTRGVGILN